MTEEKHDKEPAKPDKESERKLKETAPRKKPLTEPDKLSERILEAAKKEKKQNE